MLTDSQIRATSKLSQSFRKAEFPRLVRSLTVAVPLNPKEPPRYFTHRQRVGTANRLINKRK
jgi:hypothetical protein